MPARPWAGGANLLQNGVVRNALDLYALQLGGFLLPLATIVFLARRLGPEGWGSLAFMQAYAGYVMLVVTYGFNYSATREVARHRDDPDQLAGLIAGALGAKLALSVLTVGGGVQTLRMGWSTFVYQGALSFYTVGNGFLLGLFGSPAAVGYYVGAEKISKAFSTMLFPITQAVFPRISHLASHVQSEAAQLARKSLFIVGGAGCAMGVTILVIGNSIV